MRNGSGIGLSPIEDRIRLFLIERAKRTSVSSPFNARITYGNLCAAIDPEQHYWRGPRYRGIGTTIGNVSRWEHEHGRPLLSALVVLAGERHASDGFAGLGRELGYEILPGQERAFWRSQVEEVVRYWNGPGRDLDADSDRDALIRTTLKSAMDQLAEVARLLDEPSQA